MLLDSVKNCLTMVGSRGLRNCRYVYLDGASVEYYLYDLHRSLRFTDKRMRCVISVVNVHMNADCGQVNSCDATVEWFDKVEVLDKKLVLIEVSPAVSQRVC